MGDDAGRCCVGDSDFAEADGVGCVEPPLNLPLRGGGEKVSLPLRKGREKVSAVFSREVVLGFGHRGADAEIRSAAAYASVDEVWVVDRIAFDAGVDDLDGDVEGFGDDVCCGSAGEEIEDHLASDLGRIRRDVLVCDAVVCAEDDELAGRHARLEGALERGDLRGELFKTAERADGFGFGVEGLLEGCMELGCHGDAGAWLVRF